MKRYEKNLQTRQKIMDSAFLEFSGKSYNEASLNTICSMGGISKGITYHYFKDKDELYLACVRECFDAQAVSILTALLKTVKLRHDTTVAEVVEIFREYQDFVNARFQMKISGESTLREHEDRCPVL